MSENFYVHDGEFTFRESFLIHSLLFSRFRIILRVCYRCRILSFRFSLRLICHNRFLSFRFSLRFICNSRFL